MTLAAIALAFIQTGVIAEGSPATLTAAYVHVQVGSEIRLRLLDELSTEKSPRGTVFNLEVAEPVIVDGIDVIPVGTKAVGEVVRSEPKGAFGKSGKLEAQVLYLIDGRPVRLSGRLHAEGDGGTTETVLTALAAGTLAFVITGRAAALGPRKIIKARLDRELVLTTPAN